MAKILKNQPKNEGISLIELIMVIVIIGILSVSVAPRFETFYSIRFRTAAKKLVSDIRYAQSTAVSQHANISMTFYIANDTYLTYFTSNGTAIRDPFTHTSMIMDYNTDPQYPGIDIAAVSFNGTNTLRFNWEGKPQDYNGFDLFANNSTTVVLRYRDFDDIYLDVAPYSGRVTIRP